MRREIKKVKIALCNLHKQYATCRFLKDLPDGFPVVFYCDWERERSEVTDPPKNFCHHRYFKELTIEIKEAV